VPDEEAGRLPEALKANSESLLRRSVPVRVHILPGEEAEGVEIPRRWGEYRAQ